MSFINWGGETPEQLAARRKLEEIALYEQIVRMTQARQRAGQSVTGVAGAGGDLLIDLYGIGTNGKIYQVGRSEAEWTYNYEVFPEVTQIVSNPDDNFLYAILDLAGGIYFIRIDKKTREFTFIDNDISDFTTKGASSIYYEGNGNFIYLDNFYKSTVSSIIRITLDPSSPEYANAVEVSENDSEESGFTLRSLFLYEGTPWAVAYAGSDIITGPFNIETGNFVYTNLVLPSPEEPAVVEILYIFSAVECNGVVYASAYWLDAQENGHTGLFKVDTEYGGALAPYYLKFVKDLELEVPIISLFCF